MAYADTAWLRQAATLTVRLVILLLPLLAMGCKALPQPVEGYYRYGHEVNTVCIGEPESCYWLVDTDEDIRRQLKQLVAEKAPYTAVCVKLRAKLSTVKADGFGLDYDGSIRVQEFLSLCDVRDVSRNVK